MRSVLQGGAAKHLPSGLIFPFTIPSNTYFALSGPEWTSEKPLVDPWFAGWQVDTYPSGTAVKFRRVGQSYDSTATVISGQVLADGRIYLYTNVSTSSTYTQLYLRGDAELCATNEVTT